MFLICYLMVYSLQLKDSPQGECRHSQVSRMLPSTQHTVEWPLGGQVGPSVSCRTNTPSMWVGESISFFQVLITPTHFLLTLQVTLKGLQPPCWEELCIWILGELEASSCLLACHDAEARTQTANVIPHPLQDTVKHAAQH